MNRQIEPRVDDLLAGHREDVAGVFLALRELVREVIPDATEQVDLPDRVLAFGFGPTGGVRMSGVAVGLIPHSAHVNVQLFDGAELPDPSGIVEGTGKRIRHVKCRYLTDVERPALRAILVAQAERRRPSG